MKLRERTNNVISGGNIGEETSFKIAMNDKMFRTLSDSLYEDKIGSIVREISCNGVDAHVMAGTPEKPITIHVPNAIEPWFSVKDEGIGMSDEDIRTVYTSYGNSTKDQANDAIGAFGLGSKTPFAYTDQFTVISIHGGVKRTYIAVIGNQGLPTLSMQHEEETDEHPGLEVTIAVENKDFFQFADKIIEQLKFLPVKPHLINNMRNLKFPVLDDPKTIMFQDDKFVLGNKDFPLNRVYIKQGGVAYPLNLYHFENSDSFEFNQFLNNLENCGCVLDFAIGDIDVTASREGISYEPTTVENIKNRLFYVRDTITKEALKEIKNSKYIFSRMAYLNDLPPILGDGILASNDVSNLLGVHEKRFSHVSFDASEVTKNYTVKSLEYNMNGRIARDVRSGSSGVNMRFFTPKKDTTIYINDGVTNHIKRVKHHFEGENLRKYGNILIVASHIKKSSMTATVVKEMRDDIVKNFQIDPKDVVDISSLPELPKVERKARTYGALPTCYRYKKGANKFNSSYWDDEYDDLDDLEDTVYIGMHRHDIELTEDVKLFMGAVEAGIIDKEVVAVNQRTYKRIKEGKIGDNLLSVEDVIDDVKNECERIKPFIRAISRYNGFLRGMCNSSSGVRKFAVKGIIDREDFPEYFRAREIIMKRRDMLQERVGKYSGFVHLHNTFNIQQEAEEDGKKVSIRFFEKYPMLRYHVGYGNISVEGEKDLKEYVKMVNEVKGA